MPRSGAGSIRRPARHAVWLLATTAGLAVAALAHAGGYAPDAGQIDPPSMPAAPEAATGEPDPVRAPDPAARLPGGAQGSEYWDLIARFDEGHVVVARFLLTNLGPGKHSAVVLGHLLMPDGTRAAFRNGRRRSDWQLSDDRLKLDVNKCHLDMRDGSALLTVRKTAVQLSLRFQLTGGSRPPDGVLPPRYSADTLAANAPVEGTLQLHPMDEPLSVRGTGAVMHTWTAEPEEGRVARRLDFFTLTPGLGVQLSELRLPDGSVRTWVRATRDGRTLAEGSDLQLDASGRLPGSPGEYPVEDRLRIGGGPVDGQIAPSRLLHQQDPLEAIPQPLRSVIRWSVSMQPHQLWATAPFELSVRASPGASPEALRGEGIAAVYYLAPE